MRTVFRRKLTSRRRRIADEPETRFCRRKDATVKMKLAVFLNSLAEVSLEKLDALAPSRGENDDVCGDSLSGVELDLFGSPESCDLRTLGERSSLPQRLEEFAPYPCVLEAEWQLCLRH